MSLRVITCSLSSKAHRRRLLDESVRMSCRRRSREGHVVQIEENCANNSAEDGGHHVATVDFQSVRCALRIEHRVMDTPDYSDD